MASVIATDTSRFMDAAGLKKTGEVGGASSSRLVTGTKSSVALSTIFSYFMRISFARVKN
jgi:hypothetical protein